MYQTNRYLVAWLKRNGSYALRFGSERMPAPAYDLELFRDSIPVALSVVTPGEVHLIRPAALPEQPTVFTTKLFIWIALAVVLVALGIMSVKMIRETKSLQE